MPVVLRQRGLKRPRYTPERKVQHWQLVRSSQLCYQFPFLPVHFPSSGPSGSVCNNSEEMGASRCGRDLRFCLAYPARFIFQESSPVGGSTGKIVKGMGEKRQDGQTAATVSGIR